MRTENSISQTPPDGNSFPNQGGMRRSPIWLKPLAVVLLLVCIIGAGFLIVQGGHFSSTTSTTSQTLAKPWCTTPASLSASFSGTNLSGLAQNDVWSVNRQVTHWDGNSWTVALNPTSQEIFRSVAEITPNDIWVVGELQSNGMPSQTLTLHWDGTKWQTIKSPNVAAGGKNTLVAVSGTSANDIWAVGFFVPSQGPLGPLIEHWNGTAWTVASPFSTPLATQFTSVKALSSDDAWAVGYGSIASSSGQYLAQPVAEHWNGTKWLTAKTPNLTVTGGGNFYNIGGSSASDLWAVGSFNGGMLTEHWNGNSWNLITGASVPPNSSNWLADIAASSSSNVWAVGRIGNNGDSFQPFVEHWDGHQWRSVQDPLQGAGELDAISVVGNQFWVVGLPQDAGGHAFIETLCP